MRLIFSVVFLLVNLLLSCANPGKPSGGERDKTGPVPDTLNPFTPPNRSVNVVDGEIIIHFDEYLRPGSYASEIFVSPVQKNPPEVLVKGKSLIVRLQDSLRAGTTYIINVGKGIKDNTEGNKMKASFTYAFSTGSKLDSLFLRGSVTNPWTGMGEGDFTLLLFSEESVIGDSIFSMSPLFATQTDSTGKFLFEYLPPGRFKLYGVLDADKSYSWNQPKEKIALMPNSLLVTEDTTSKNQELLSFLPDNEGPRLKSIRWVNKYAMVAEFREPLRDSILKKGIPTLVGDTAGGEKNNIDKGAFRYGERTVFYFQPGVSPKEWSSVHLKSLADTLGNSGDTLVVVKPWEEQKKKQAAFREPAYNALEKKFYIRSDFPLGENIADTMVEILDTSGKKIKIAFRTSPFQIEVELKEEVKPQLPHKLIVKKGFSLADSLQTDTTTVFNVTFPDPDNFGIISGEIVPDSAAPDAKWILLLVKKGKNETIMRRTQGEKTFRFEMLEPGPYRILLIKDDDNNGVYTPGSISPYRMPEKIVVGMADLDVRAKWDVAGLKISAAGEKKEAGGKLK